MVRESLALRPGGNKAKRERTNGLNGDGKTKSQGAVLWELRDEGRHSFTTWGAQFQFMDDPTSFGTLFGLAGLLRLMR